MFLSTKRVFDLLLQWIRAAIRALCACFTALHYFQILKRSSYTFVELSLQGLNFARTITPRTEFYQNYYSYDRILTELLLLWPIYDITFTPMTKLWQNYWQIHYSYDLILPELLLDYDRILTELLLLWPNYDRTMTPMTGFWHNFYSYDQIMTEL